MRITQILLLLFCLSFEAVVAHVNVILTRPTDEGITLSLITKKSCYVGIEYGTNSNSLSQMFDAGKFYQGVPKNVEITGLAADTKYYYKLLIDGVPAEDGPSSFQTAREKGSDFKFSVMSDSHFGEEPMFGGGKLYLNTLQNIAEGSPDFVVDLGDTFMGESLVWEQEGVGEDKVVEQHQGQRAHLGTVLHSFPMFSVRGNRDGEYGYFRGGERPVAEWAARARTKYFPMPHPEVDDQGQEVPGFYTGNIQKEEGIGFVEDYYAWTWGDALFVVLDPYWYTKSHPQDGWGWTLGRDQHAWLTRTLEANHDVRWKFVFCHALVGGGSAWGQRGGAEMAHYFEWGGNNLRGGSYQFDARRYGWGDPVHTLFLKHNVDVFFHGHDHFYGYQEVDGVVYQETPKSDRPFDMGLKRYGGYEDGVFLPNAGHLEISVTTSEVTVSYIRSLLPDSVPEEDEDIPIDWQNKEVSHSYTIQK